MAGAPSGNAGTRPAHPPGRGGAAQPLAVGLFLGALVLWRVVLLPFLALVPLFPACRRRFRTAGLLFLGAAILPGAWVLRNGLSAGYWGVSTVAALNLYRYEAAALEADRTGRSFAEQQARFDAQLERRPTQAARARFAFREGLALCRQVPLRLLWLHLRADLGAFLPAAGELLRTFGVQVGGRGTLGVLQDRGLGAAVRHYFGGHRAAALLGGLCAGILLLKYLAAAAGIAVAVLRGKACGVHWLLAAALAYFLLVPGPAAEPRFRTAVDPILSVYAGLGLGRLRRLAAARAREPSPENGQAD